MRRVVVTGLGIVSSIGNNAAEVLESLKEGRSGITANEDMKEYGFRSQIAGDIKGLNLADMIDKRTLRFMGPGAAYAYLAMEQAIADAGLDQSLVSSKRTGLVAGSGGPSGCVKGRIAQTHWATCGSKMYVIDHLSEPVDSV